jgi:hypothetical protein
MDGIVTPPKTWQQGEGERSRGSACEPVSSFCFFAPHSSRYSAAADADVLLLVRGMGRIEIISSLPALHFPWPPSRALPVVCCKCLHTHTLSLQLALSSRSGLPFRTLLSLAGRTIEKVSSIINIAHRLPLFPIYFPPFL